MGSEMCIRDSVESGGVNPLRGQNNVQGACDMAALPNIYPGYQKVDDPKVQEKFEVVRFIVPLGEWKSKGMKA